MAFAVGPASARNFSVSFQSWRATFSNLEFIAEGFNTTTCRVTLEGSLHARTIAKTAGTLLGYMNRITTGQCSGEVTILAETLPWHTRYVGFSGRLPDITLILIRLRWSLRILVCLISADLDARLSRDPATRHLVLAQILFQLLSTTGIFCPVLHLGFRANVNGSVFQSLTNTRISVTLI